jgi:hypothetical protein
MGGIFLQRPERLRFKDYTYFGVFNPFYIL